MDNTLSPLPVELLTFNAMICNNTTQLTWTTATETNNDYFTVEKSKDASSFEEVLTVKGAGNSNSIVDYSDIDYHPYTGISYYRLKQTDFDGHVTYSNVVPIEYNPNGDASISLFPNPADNSSITFLSLNEFNGQEVLVVLRDITGKEIYSKVIVTVSNNELVALNQDNKLAPGTYLITASSVNKFYSKHLIVK